MAPDPATGARRRKWLYGKTKAEVVDKMRRADRACEVAVSDRSRTDAFLRSWLEGTVKPSMRPATAATYESVVESHIIPSIGALRVDKLTTTIISRFYSDLRDDGVGDRTRQKVHAVLHRALASAVRLKMLSTNPAALEDDAPKYRAPEREPLTASQARRLLRAARGDRLEALYVLALVTGARQGELFALTWADIDFKSRTLTIRRSLQDGDGKGTLISGATKTRSSRRRIELPEAAVAAVKRHQEAMRDEGLSIGERSLVFPARNGEPIRRQNFMRRDFSRLLDRATVCESCGRDSAQHLERTGGACAKWKPDFPRIHFHDLRHTAATLAAAAGKQVVAVAALLGHADPTITLRTYQHAFEGAAGDTARALGDVLLSDSET